QGAVHAGDADRRQQGTDGRRNQTDQERHQGRHIGAQALHRLRDAEIPHHVLLGVPGHRPQRDDDDQENEGEGGEDEGEGNLVGGGGGGRGGGEKGEMRGEKKHPAAGAVTRTTSGGETTGAPPVPRGRPPPASRITGADSPVIADSSTDATPSMISPSPGMI